MVSQLELFDLSSLAPPAVRPDDWFFALRPPEADAIADLARDEAGPRYPGKLIRPVNLHVTLYPVGDGSFVDSQLVARAISAGALVRHKRFEVAFDRIQTFNGRGRYPIVLTCGQGADDIRALRALIAEAMGRFGFPRHNKTITPHLTLWYDKNRIPDHELAHPFTWTVQNFCLVHSIYGRAKHELHGPWPLQDQGDIHSPM